jgi:exosortase
LLLAAVIVVGLFVPMFDRLVAIWLLDPNYFHGFLILPVSLLLAWLAVDGHPLPERTEPGEARSGAITLGLGLCFHLAGVVLRYPPVEFIALLLVLRGLAVLVGGTSWANRLLFPTLFLAFMFPLPPDLMSRFAVGLQGIIAPISEEVLGWFVLCYRRGNVIYLTTPGAEPLFVAAECSGVRQLMAFVAMGTLVAYLGKTGWARGLLLVALAVPVAIVANVARVLLMGFGMVYFGPSWFSTWLHDMPALITIPLGIVGYFGLVWLVAPASSAEKTQ